MASESVATVASGAVVAASVVLRHVWVAKIAGVEGEAAVVTT